MDLAPYKLAWMRLILFRMVGLPPPSNRRKSGVREGAFLFV